MNRWSVAAAVLAVTTVAAGLVGYRIGLADDDRDEAAVLAGAAEGADDGTPAGAGGGDAARSAPVADDGRYGGRVTPVLARTASDGTLVRVVEQRWDAGEQGGPGWTPPPSCRAVGSLEVGLVTDIHVAMGWAEVFGDDPATSQVWGAGWAGDPQLGAVEFVVVRTASDVRTVRLERDGSMVDEAEPVGGWAVVAAQGDPGTPSALVLVGADGAMLDRRPAEQVDLPYERAECQPPPPPLPDSVRPAGDGDTQAAAAIAAAYAGVFGRPSGEDRLDPRGHLTGGDGIDDAFLDELRDNVSSFGIEQIEVEIARTGFVDDDTALVVFRLVGAPVGWTYGEAELVDGAWLASSQTWCSLISLAGSQCSSTLWQSGRGTSRFPPPQH